MQTGNILVKDTRVSLSASLRSNLKSEI